MSKFIAMIENKAFVLALLSSAAAAAAIFGYSLPVTAILSVYAPLMAMLGVQGWQTATQTQLQMQHDHELKMHVLQNPADAPRAKQLGSSRLMMMLGIGIVAGALLAGIQLARDGSSAVTTTDVVEGIALGPAGCATTPPIVTDVVNCVEAEATAIGSGYSVAQVVAAVWGAVAGVSSGGLTAALTILEGLAVQFGPNLVACIVDGYPSGAGGGSAGSGSAAPAPAPASFRLALDAKAQLLNVLAPGKKFNHGKGATK
jgi:hypothetical protein